MKFNLSKLLSCFAICAMSFLLFSCQGEQKQENSTQDNTTNADINKQLEASTIKEDIELAIHYKSPNDLISVENNILNHIQIKQMFVKGSTSGTPDSIARTSLATDMLLSPKKLQILKKAIITSGFMGLEDAYGAAKDQRNYPTSIKVQFQGKTKEVVFRSNPSFNRSPVSFKKVENALMRLHKVAVYTK